MEFSRDAFFSTNTTRRIKKGAYVLYSGEGHQQNCFLILKGSVSVCLISANGHEMLLYHLGAGELIGELAMFGIPTRSATVIADEDCVLLEITKHEFHEKMKEPAFVAQMNQVFLQRYLDTHEVVCRLAQPNISMKLCRCISTLVHQQDDSEQTQQVRILLPSHAELAKMISCQRESVTREIKKLIQQGVLTHRRASWYMADKQRIAHFLSGNI